MINFHLDVNGKSARVALHGLPAERPRTQIKQSTSTGPIQSRRLVTGVRAQAADLGFEALRDGDPELDFSLAGTAIEADDVSTAFYDPAAAEPKPIGDFKDIDIVFDAAGEEKARRPHLVRRPNLDELHPVKVVKRMPLNQALMSFSVRQVYQVAHVDGLSFEFLRDLAGELHRTQEVALLGAGAKANQPLVVREHGSAYRGFLSGEVNDQGHYQLLLLLSDQELKLPSAE
ncbi:hypothetical protein [Pseudomarimonas arenosa]|uniref:Uncharacterized protein n=1 Tax=Pseudomarimonas arenosa TaxID=2774145 RepID=A0AAW3ZGL3_9GAMM|nr:hypothetical protein [Pseudomarimonas arenosa]MBD8525258.1 hypothetical protein [Pseudomarimonas arenosa]